MIGQMKTKKYLVSISDSQKVFKGSPLWLSFSRIGSVINIGRFISFLSLQMEHNLTDGVTILVFQGQKNQFPLVLFIEIWFVPLSRTDGGSLS